ncbi:MAG: EamA family transporter [Nanoarchaeota archaeon]
MNWALFFAFLSGAILGLMNVFDTYIVKLKVKNVIGFAMVSAFTNILFGIILALFLDWSNYSLSNYLFPIIAGLVMGIQLFFYYFMLSKHDASHAIGLFYIYPIIVAILSFLFLNEQLSFYGYIGMAFTLIGVLLLSGRMKKMKVNFAFWSLAIVIIGASLHEFFAKVAVNQINPWHGATINSIVMGWFAIVLLFKEKYRNGFKSEFKNVKLTFISELLTLAGILSIYLAMVGLPATIVSVVSVVQPLFVLFFEWVAFSFGIKIVKDINWKNKLFAIVMIIIGLILLYFNDII